MSGEVLLAIGLGVVALALVFVIDPWLKRRANRRALRESLRGYRARLHAPQTRESLGRIQRMRIERRRP